MTYASLREICRATMEGGPTRVVINESGEAVAPSRSTKPVDIIFVRDDGWSLGAPIGLIGVAEAMWIDQWVGVIIPGEPVPVTYESWKYVNSTSLKP
jgi:hypothetical protein